MNRRDRVIQWGTGNVGREALRGILLHPGLELAGVRVFSQEKNGVDAGHLCGLPETRIEATTSFEAILACEADCVAYMPRHAHLDEVCALLRSGKNVVCTPFLFHPEAQPKAAREALRSACDEGGSSVHGTGIHPGFVGMVLPLALSGMSRSIRSLRIQEKADWTHYDSPRITFDNMRFGHPPEAASLDANPFARFNASLFEDQIHLLAQALGAGAVEVSVEQELLVSEAAYDVRAGRVEAGTVNGQRYRWRGRSGDRVLIEIDALWTLGGPYPAGWPRPREGWTVLVEGDPSFQCHFVSLASFERRDVPLEDHVHAADIATAMQAINSIPALCQAPVGLRASYELGLVRSGIGFRAD
jgi:hypothetical protein